MLNYLVAALVALLGAAYDYMDKRAIGFVALFLVPHTAAAALQLAGVCRVHAAATSVMGMVYNRMIGAPP